MYLTEADVQLLLAIVQAFVDVMPLSLSEAKITRGLDTSV
jgi:hypothetical protein